MSDTDLHESNDHGLDGVRAWDEDTAPLSADPILLAHDNDPFLDDEYVYHTPAPALPAYGDVLAALGNPRDPLAAIAALQAEIVRLRAALEADNGND